MARQKREPGTPDIRVRNGKKYVYRRTRRVTALSPAHMDPLWQSLDKAIGGRDGMLAAAVASSNPKAADLIPMLLDSAYQRWGTKKLAQKAGMSASEVVDMFRDRKWLEGVLAIHEELPDILRDAAQDARASKIPCPECHGAGKRIIDNVVTDCWVCSGSGKLRKPGDKDKLAFVGEAAGVIGKKGPAVQLNQQFNVVGQPGVPSFEELMRKATISPVSGPKSLPAATVEEASDDMETLLDENSLVPDTEN